MANEPVTDRDALHTAISPMLSVRDGARAIDLYKRAFGATEVMRITAPDRALVAELSIDGARLFLADESPENSHFSPESPGGSSVRIELFVADPDAVAARAVGAGETETL